MEALIEVLLKLILKTFFFVLIIALILMSIKVLFDYIKYGKKIFSSFEKKNTKGAYVEILNMSLNKIKNPKIILKPKKLYADYILINSVGIMLFKIFSKMGSFKYKDNYLYYDDKTRIISPSYLLDEDIKKIKELLPNIPVYKKVVIMENAFIDSNIEQITLKNIPYISNDGDISNLEEIKNILSKSV